MTLGYLHCSNFFLENCIHTSDWVGFFWLLCCFWKSVTNSECSSTISLYSIWPAPVARGNTPGIAFSFCLSYFLISQHCCHLPVLSATESAQSPCSTRPQSVFVAAQWSHILHFTHFVTIRLSGGNRNVHKTCQHAEWVCVSVRRGNVVDFLTWHRLRPNEYHYRAEVNSYEWTDLIWIPFCRWQPLLPLFDLLDMFSNPSCYLFNLSIHHSPAGHRLRHLLPVITPMSPYCHPLPKINR